MPAKKGSLDKIDGIVATVMGVALAINPDVEGPSVYEERGIVEVEMTEIEF